MQKTVGISHFPHFTHFWFQKCGRYFCCIPTLIIDFWPFSTNKDLKYFSTLTRPKTFWKVCKCGNRLLSLYINTYSQFGFPRFTRFWNVKCVLCGFLTPVSTLLPLNFTKSTQKKFANVVLCGFLIPSSTLLVCKKCGHFMISPHSCHNMCQYVSTTPISTLETRCHLQWIFEKNYQAWSLK